MRAGNRGSRRPIRAELFFTYIIEEVASEVCSVTGAASMMDSGFSFPRGDSEIVYDFIFPPC